MKETVNVSIAGIAFILDNESYVLLSDYLQRLRAHMKGDPDAAEILSDIESRIAELILTAQSADHPVSESVIKEILEQLGDVNPVDAADSAGESASKSTEKIPRRLYRNPEGAKIGGVCSGIGTYFGIDPVIIRLVFILPLVILLVAIFPILDGDNSFLTGFANTSPLLYLVLWVALPKATNARQKLELRGEPVTVDSIRQNIDRREANIPAKAGSAAADVIDGIGKLILTCVRVFCGIAGVMVFLAGISAAIATVIFGNGAFTAQFNELAMHLGISLGAVMCVIGVTVSLPLLCIGYMLLAVAFNLSVGKTLMTVLFSLWILLIIFVATIFICKGMGWDGVFRFDWDNLASFR